MHCEVYCMRFNCKEKDEEAKTRCGATKLVPHRSTVSSLGYLSCARKGPNPRKTHLMVSKGVTNPARCRVCIGLFARIMASRWRGRIYIYMQQSPFMDVYTWNLLLYIYVTSTLLVFWSRNDMSRIKKKRAVLEKKHGKKQHHLNFAPGNCSLRHAFVFQFLSILVIYCLSSFPAASGRVSLVQS